jgi:hypothetical protein
MNLADAESEPQTTSGDRTGCFSENVGGVERAKSAIPAHNDHVDQPDGPVTQEAAGSSPVNPAR